MADSEQSQLLAHVAKLTDAIYNQRVNVNVCNVNVGRPRDGPVRMGELDGPGIFWGLPPAAPRASSEPPAGFSKATIKHYCQQQTH